MSVPRDKCRWCCRNVAPRLLYKVSSLPPPLYTSCPSSPLPFSFSLFLAFPSSACSSICKLTSAFSPILLFSFHSIPSSASLPSILVVPFLFLSFPPRSSFVLPLYLYYTVFPLAKLIHACWCFLLYLFDSLCVYFLLRFHIGVSLGIYTYSFFPVSIYLSFISSIISLVYIIPSLAVRLVCNYRSRQLRD